MQPTDVRLDPALTEVRQRRAELRESMNALEISLAVPAVGRVDFWAERVGVALVELSGDFTTHVAITEGPDGLHREIAQASPRLTFAVNKLTDEHRVIAEQIEKALTLAGATPPDVDAIRDASTDLFGRLVRHRQRGADLIFEAFETDIGGET